MNYKTIEINIDYKALGCDHDDKPATMVTYIKDQFQDMQNPFNRPFIIICPGGGYDHHSPREGEAIAIKMMDLGYNAMILRYSLLPNQYPCALFDAAYAVSYARKHAKDWDIDPNKIIIAGFSAGGHVAASLGTMWNQIELQEFFKQNELTPQDIRPNGMLLGYSVLTEYKDHPRASIKKILGDRYDSLVESICLEKRVTESTPPAFLWHTATDQDVPFEHSFAFASACKAAGVSFEIHVFPFGKHGLGLGSAETDMKDGTHSQPAVTIWPELFSNWIENI